MVEAEQRHNDHQISKYGWDCKQAVFFSRCTIHIRLKHKKDAILDYLHTYIRYVETFE